MKNKMLYLGDSSLNRQASYLAGVMSYYNLDFDYVSSDRKFSDSLLDKDHSLLILSDYPAANFSEKQAKVLVDKIEDGMGFLMIGGWESFIGDGGDYHRTPFAEALPVVMQGRDDRVNFSSPCLVLKEQGHEIIDLLPFHQNIPVIGGLNAFDAKRGSDVLLSGVEFEAARNDLSIDFKESRSYPLLVLGDYGLGRTAAFASDVAPHWVGPFVDWGNKRIKARADGSQTIEVGNWYAEFFANVLQWLCVKNYETINLI
ncbi:MAG: glutamine amidotransferase [Planctomycetota bacterium]|jgi:uncharacterized membrane protein